MTLEPQIFAAADAKLRIRGSFTYNDIEEVLGEIYKVGDDRPTIEDDEMHEMVSELHQHYVDLKLVKEGE